MSHTDEKNDEMDRPSRRSGPNVATAAETLVVPLGLVLDVATSLSSGRR